MVGSIIKFIKKYLPRNQYKNKRYPLNVYLLAEGFENPGIIFSNELHEFFDLSKDYKSMHYHDFFIALPEYEEIDKIKHSHSDIARLVKNLDCSISTLQKTLIRTIERLENDIRIFDIPEFEYQKILDLNSMRTAVLILARSRITINFYYFESEMEIIRRMSNLVNAIRRLHGYYENLLEWETNWELYTIDYFSYLIRLTHPNYKDLTCCDEDVDLMRYYKNAPALRDYFKFYEDRVTVVSKNFLKEYDEDYLPNYDSEKSEKELNHILEAFWYQRYRIKVDRNRGVKPMMNVLIFHEHFKKYNEMVQAGYKYIKKIKQRVWLNHIFLMPEDSVFFSKEQKEKGEKEEENLENQDDNAKSSSS